MKCELCYAAEKEERGYKNPDLVFHSRQDEYRHIAGFSGRWDSGYQREKHEVE